MTAPADRPPSILKVVDDEGRLRATALLIGVDTVATAAHVLESGQVSLVAVRGEETYPAEVLRLGRLSDHEPGPDLAILRFTGPRPKMRPATLISRVSAGELVRIFGVSSEFPSGVWAQGTIAGRFESELVQINITGGSVTAGFSGAPVMAADGEVLGMVLQRSSNESGQEIVFMLSAETILSRQAGLSRPHRPAEPVRQRLGGGVYSGYAPDAATGEDLLHRGAEVEALALLIAARSTAPPMSVGLFGDWGTGKTFFLEKLRDRIRALTTGPMIEEPVCRQVRQIVFNAWHYTDANLWASLVSAIFAELAEPRHGESIAEAQERWAGQRRMLVRELETTREQLDEAQARYESAETAVAQAADALAEVRADRGRDRHVLRTMRAVGELVLADADVQKSLSQARAQLELRSDADLRELRRASDDTVAITQRLGRVWSLIRAQDRRRVTAWFWVAGAVAAALCVAVPLVVDRFADGVAQVFATLVACAIPLAAGARHALRLIGRVAGIAESVAEKAAKVEQEVREQQAHEESAMLAELHDLEFKEAELRAELAAAQGRRDAAARALEDAESGRQLASFVRERSESADYQGQLGIIATVRRDFDRLAELLTQADFEPAPRPLERIVLYVDDLDRCSPERVVEVLQAVHLLLGLPLFVVVVAVDPRWMLGALDLHFERVLGRKRTAAPETRHWAATPVNYLEKIFQIPFNLSAMPPEDFEGLVDALIATDVSSPVAPVYQVIPRSDGSSAQGESPLARTAPSGEQEVAAARRHECSPPTGTSPGPRSSPGWATGGCGTGSPRCCPRSPGRSPSTGSAAGFRSWPATHFTPANSPTRSGAARSPPDGPRPPDCQRLPRRART